MQVTTVISLLRLLEPAVTPCSGTQLSTRGAEDFGGSSGKLFLKRPLMVYRRASRSERVQVGLEELRRLKSRPPLKFRAVRVGYFGLARPKCVRSIGGRASRR